MANALRVEIIEGGEVARVELLDQDVIKVGKLSSSHLRLEDANVSRIHAVIERSPSGGFSVIDLGSATGTYVNGAKVTKVELSSGDELQFGDTVIRVTIDANAVVTVVPVAEPAPAASALDNAPTQVAPAPSAPTPSTQTPAAQTPSVVVSEPAPVASTAPAEAEVPIPGNATVSADGLVTLADGSTVEPFTVQGYYDDAGNYIPGYYDATGEYHLGYGFYDEAGLWQVTFGYYDPDGEWVDSDSPVSSVSAVASDTGLAGAGLAGAGFAGAGLADETSWMLGHIVDRDEYQAAFARDRGGDTLEVALLWRDHVLQVNSYEGRSVTIGGSEKNDFVMEDESFSDEFALVNYDGSGYSVGFTDRMSGVLYEGDESYTLEEAVQRGLARRAGGSGFEVPLSSRTSVRVDVGESTFLVHFTDMPALVGGGLVIDTAAIPYYVVSGVAHVAFLLLAMMMPDRARSLNLDGFSANDRFVQMMITPEQEEEEEPDWLKDGDGDEEAAAKHKGEEGKAGKEDAEETNNKLAIKGTNENEDLVLKKAIDTEIAMSAGIASELMVSSPWGTGDTSVGSDAIHALGNLQGDSFGEARGFGGLGLHGAGRGGGGVSEHGIGLANVGTAGRGGGGRGGAGYGKGAGDLGDRSARVPKVVPGRPEVQGSLDREIIQRVIRQHRREIRNCYEQELQKNKDLAGRVLVQFTISATGSVVSAVVKESSLKNAAVENCMSTRIRRWMFPEPKGGGIVIVSYPFNLSS